MPSDDLVLNVRQIAGYPPVTTAPAAGSILLQTAGLGSAYASISPADLVGTALSSGGDMAIGGKLSALSFSGGSAQFSNAAINLFSAQRACINNLDAGIGSIAGVPIATQLDLAAAIAGTVWSFNGRRNDVTLWIQDILKAGGAPIFSPRFMGSPRAETPAPWSSSTRLATTAFVQRNFIEGVNNLLKDHPFVFTFNGRTGDVVLTAQDIIEAGGEGEIFDSPTFTGIPTAPTAPPGTNTTQIATTAFVTAAIAGGPFAPIDSPTFTGYVSGPTPPPGSSTGQFATTAFVMNAVQESTTGVASFNGRTGLVIFEAADVTGVGGALLSGPTFTGIPTAPTAVPGTNTTQLATTAYVEAALSGVSGVTSFNTRMGAVSLVAADVTAVGGALLASPTFTGTPSGPTAPTGTNTTQLATCAFVQAAISSETVESFNGRTGNVTLSAADISAAGGAALQSPAFLGTPTAPTPPPGTNSTQLATTAYVTAAIAAGGGVSSFNTRTGAVVLTLPDVTAVGGAPLASPTMSGTPTSRTAAPGTNTNQLATTAFVQAALAGGAGVSSFNTRTGAVVLTSADIIAAGGAPLGSPAFTGSPTAPTATAGTSSTAIATTAFVNNAIATTSVLSFNGRLGAVTLTSADISAAGGAVLASPAFTGSPTAPTATAGTNSGQLATTAFVQTALSAAGGVSSFNGRAGVVTLSNADVIAVLPGSAAAPLINGTAAAGTATAWSRGDHVHPTDTSRAAASALAGYLPLTGGTLTGALTQTSATSPQINLSKGSGANQNVIQGGTGGSPRWQIILGNSNTESGAATGSDFGINRCNNAGTILDTPFFISRANGQAQFNGDLMVTAAAGQPTYSLAFNQTELAQFYYNVTSGDTGLYHIASGQTCGMLNNGIFNITSTIAQKPGGGAWADSSDARVKTVERDYALGLDEVRALHPVVYVYKGNDARAAGERSPHADLAASRTPFVGLIAQEVEAIFPGMVTRLEGLIDGEKVTDLRQLNVSELIFALVNAVKQLASRIEVLEAAP